MRETRAQMLARHRRELAGLKDSPPPPFENLKFGKPVAAPDPEQIREDRRHYAAGIAVYVVLPSIIIAGVALLMM